MPDSLLTLRSTPDDVKLRRLVDGLNSADEEFPYSRTLYESSPLARSLLFGTRNAWPIEQRNETSTFTRRFVYNSVGFFLKLIDPFLEQEIDHSEATTGYDQPAFGDGPISRVTFKVH